MTTVNAFIWKIEMVRRVVCVGGKELKLLGGDDRVTFQVSTRVEDFIGCWDKLRFGRFLTATAYRIVAVEPY